MSLKSIYETMEKIKEKQVVLSEEDKQSVMQFVYKTGDEELTSMYINDLLEAAEEKPVLHEKYEAILDEKPKWINHVENLLVAIELYRIEEEKAIKKLTQILGAYGIDVSIEENNVKEPNEFTEKVKKEMSL